MRINDQPLSRFGLEPVSSDGRVSFAAGSLVVAEIPETSGAQLVTIEKNRPRRVTVRCRIRGDTDSAFFANRDKFAELLDGALEVRFSDVDQLAERILYCQFEDYRTVGDPGPEWLQPNRGGELILVATDPYFYDRSASFVGDGEIPVGSAPSGQLTTIVGGAITGNLQFVLKDFRGNVVNRLKWTGTLSAGQWLEIRHQPRYLTRKFTAVGSYTDASADLDETATDFGFFAVTPDLANRVSSAWPRIEVESGAPASIVTSFRRGWH